MKILPKSKSDSKIIMVDVIQFLSFKNWITAIIKARTTKIALSR